jgi:hypothetical protein
LAQTDNKIPTVKDNQAWFTKKQIDGANRARAFQRIACYPPDADLIKALSLGKLKNVDFTIDDVKNAAKIYGPDLAAIKGRTTRKEGRGPINDYMEIPEEFIEAHKDIELTMDIVTVEGLKFFHSKDTNIKYHYVEYLPNTKQPALDPHWIKCLVDTTKQACVSTPYMPTMNSNFSKMNSKPQSTR